MTEKTPTQQPTQAQTQQQEDKPVSTRDSIRAAFAEQKEKLKAQEDNSNLSSEKKEEIKPEVKEDKKEETREETKKEEKKEEVKEVSSPSEGDEPKIKEEEKGEKKEDAKSKGRAPFGIDKDLRAVWDDLPEIAQQRLSKLTKESLDRKAEDGRRGQFRDVDQILTPLLPELQQVGATPAQFVKRIVDYTHALAHPKYQYQAIAQLANDYGIDLTLFGNKGLENKDQKDNQIEQPQDNIPPELNQKLDNILNRFSQIETSQKSENEKAALNHLNDWSGFNSATNEFTKKPYFPYVRQTMFSLISSGTVPMKDGKLDLDGAYDAACYAHPEIRDHIMEEQSRVDNARKEQERQQQLARAKNAGSSLRPGAPTSQNGSNNTSPKLNSKGQPLTVRDSLRAAIAEMRSGQ